jgi:hypothetical protein
MWLAGLLAGCVVAALDGPASASARASSSATAPTAASRDARTVLTRSKRERSSSPTLWIWFDDDGTPVVSDRRDSPDAEPYRIGTFEEVVLRQRGAPHRGVLATATAPLVPDVVRTLAEEAARKHGLESHLVLAVIGIESAFREGRVSRAGARGLMQLMPDTAADLDVDADNPRENVDGGTRYLAGLLRLFGDERLALAAYNAGPGRVRRAGNAVPAIPETIAYVDAVLALKRAFVDAANVRESSSKPSLAVGRSHR